MVSQRNESGVRPHRRDALRALAALALCGLTACGGAVQTERVTAYPLEQPHSYAWVTDELVLIQLGDDQPNVRTPQNEQRLRAAIDRALQARGFTAAPRDQADLLVAFSVGTTMRYRVEGGAAGSSYGGMEPGAKQTKGTLNIYLLDRAKHSEVWHGWTSKWLSKSDDPDAVVNDAVAKIMAAFPGPQ
jgi:Domain of unknown function (DUF4136)